MDFGARAFFRTPEKRFDAVRTAGNFPHLLCDFPQIGTMLLRQVEIGDVEASLEATVSRRSGDTEFSGELTVKF